MEIEKHLTITGSSTVSWKDAIVKAIEELLRQLTICQVLEI